MVQKSQPFFQICRIFSEGEFLHVESSTNEVTLSIVVNSLSILIYSLSIHTLKGDAVSNPWSKQTDRLIGLCGYSHLANFSLVVRQTFSKTFEPNQIGPFREKAN